MLRKYNVRSIRDTHLNADITLIIRPIIIRGSSMPWLILIASLWLSFHGESQPDPESWDKLWGNLKPNHAMNFREQSVDLGERIDFPSGKKQKIFDASEFDSQSLALVTVPCLFWITRIHTSNWNPRYRKQKMTAKHGKTTTSKDDLKWDFMVSVTCTTKTLHGSV